MTEKRNDDIIGPDPDSLKMTVKGAERKMKPHLITDTEYASLINANEGIIKSEKRKAASSSFVVAIWLQAIFMIKPGEGFFLGLSSISLVFLVMGTLFGLTNYWAFRKNEEAYNSRISRIDKIIQQESKEL